MLLYVPPSFFLLCIHSLERQGVGNNDSIHHVEELLQSDLGLFYTPESRYSKVRSKYENRSISTSVIPLKAAKYLSGGNNNHFCVPTRTMINCFE